MTRTAFDIHKSFAQNVTFGESILWDAYGSDQFSVFMDKLKQLLPDPGELPSDDKRVSVFSNIQARLFPSSEEDRRSEPNKAMQKLREKIYKSTISQTKYTNKNLLAGFVLVTVAEGTRYIEARNATKFSIHLVIRTRKCLKNNDSTGCCMAFIDETGNVYRNWNHFVETNSLPKGVAFAPTAGYYTEQENTNNLNMDAWATPASGLGSQVLGATDVAAGVGGFAAAGVTVAAICTVPVAAPVLLAAGAVGLGTGIYSAGRSIWQLWDKNDHEQSIALTDQSARGAWLGVASGAFAATAAAANRSLAQVALAGREISLVRETIVNGMNISTLLVSGVGVGNGVMDLILKWTDDENITTLDVVQLAASLVIFTHSVYNFRLASKMFTQAQDAKVNAYREELSNRQRRMFDKLNKETIRTQGAAKGKVDLIRLINEVPDKQYLNDLHKINKDLNKNNVRFTAGPDGNIVLNGEVPVATNDLRASVQHGQGENILGKVSQPIPESHATIPNAETVNLLTTNAFSENSSDLFKYCISLGITAQSVLSQNVFQDCVRFLIEKLGTDLTAFLLDKAREFIALFQRKIEDVLRTAVYIDTVLWDLYKQCEKMFVDFTIEELEQNMTEIFQRLLDYYERMSSQNFSGEWIKCTDCDGSYQLCSID